MDFCNSFWGLDDIGVDVLFARMQSAAQTIEDLNAFWKERASIEEDYANRLAKLAEMSLGRDEIGDLRKSLDAIRADTKHPHMSPSPRRGMWANLLQILG